MSKSRTELKLMAKKQIKGNVGILFVITVIIAVISALANLVLSFIPVVGSLAAAIVISPAFVISIWRIYLNLDFKNPDISDVFLGFDDFWTAFKANFLVSLFTFLWSLLFYIPGIIKSLSYSQTMAIIAENRGVGALEAINRSKVMMEGHKADLFVLCLSFIGWLLLGAVTFGIAYIWVGPYIQATLVNFYNDIKAE